MRGSRLWLCGVVAMLSAAGGLAAGGAEALARSPIAWTHTYIDGKPPRARQLANRGLDVSCVANGHACAAVDKLGNVIWTSNVTAAKPHWRLKKIDYDKTNGSVGLDSVSCPSTSLCVAADNNGDLLSSLDPWATNPKWQIQHLESDYTVVYDVFCSSSSLCIGVDNQGDMLTSTTLSAPSPAWSYENVDESKLIAGIACPSISLCVAVDSEGDTLISEDPTAPTPSWTIHLEDHRAGFASISCPSISFCVAGDTKGNVMTSTDTGAESPVWKLRNVDGVSTSRFGLKSLSVSCSPDGSLCVAADLEGRVTVSTNPVSGTPNWNTRQVDGKGNTANGITGVSCPSAQLCVLGDSAGNVLIGRRTAR